jgi:hypothetical protein
MARLRTQAAMMVLTQPLYYRLDLQVTLLASNFGRRRPYHKAKPHPHKKTPSTKLFGCQQRLVRS